MTYLHIIVTAGTKENEQNITPTYVVAYNAIYDNITATEIIIIWQSYQSEIYNPIGLSQSTIGC